MLHLFAMGLLACAERSADSGRAAELPPDSGGPDAADSGTGWIPVDTGTDGPSDEVPAHTLACHQVGAWEAPGDTLTGALEIWEVLDGAATACRAAFSLTGERAAEACPGCEEAFSVLFYLTAEGDPEDEEVGGLDACRCPDLPTADVRYTLGYAPAEEAIYLNYSDSGVWIPWYDASDSGGTVTFSWSAEIGVEIEEEEDKG